MNSIICIKEIEFAVKNSLLHTHKTPAPDDSKFLKTFKEEIAPMSHKLFQRIENGRMFTNSIYAIKITHKKKSDKDIIRKKNYMSIPLMQINFKILLKYFKIECSDI